MATHWKKFKKELLAEGHVTPDSLMLADIKLRLAELFYELRIKHKMSQKALADSIGVSQPYIARIEDGEENLTIETIAKLLVALKTRFKVTAEARHGHKESVFQFMAAA